MAYIKLKDPTSFIIKKQVVRVEKLVGQRNKFKEIVFKKKIKLTESLRREETEESLEKYEDRGSKIKGFSTPRLGFLDSVKNFLFTVLFGSLALKLLPYLPQLKGLLITTLKVGNFAIEFAGTILNAMVTFVDKVYGIIDFGKKQAKILGGDSGVKNYENMLGMTSKVMNYVLIAGMLFSDLIVIKAQADSNQSAIGDIGKEVTEEIVKRQGFRAAIQTAGRAIGGVAKSAGIVLIVGLAASLLGELSFQQRKFTKKLENDVAYQLKEANSDPNPITRALKLVAYNAALPGLRYFNFISTGVGTLLDIIGAPFRYLGELVNLGIMSLTGDAGGIKKQRENLGKLDARIREQIREVVNTLSLGTLAKEKGSFGSLYGSSATTAMGYASGGAVTREGQEAIGGVITRTGGKRAISRTFEIPMSPLNPGADVGGQMNYVDPDTKKPTKSSNIETFFPNPKDSQYINSYEYLTGSYNVISSGEFLKPFLQMPIKMIMGNGSSEGDYNSLASATNNLFINILRKTLVPGTKKSLADELGFVDIFSWARDSIRVSMIDPVNTLLQSLKEQFMLKSGGGPGKIADSTALSDVKSSSLEEFAGEAQFVIGDSIAHGFAGRSGNGSDSEDTMVGRSPEKILAYLKSKGDKLSGMLIDLSTGIANSPEDYKSVEEQLSYLKSIGAKVRVLGVADPFSKKNNRINEKLDRMVKSNGFYFYGGYKGEKDGIHGTPTDYSDLKAKQARDTTATKETEDPSAIGKDNTVGNKSGKKIYLHWTASGYDLDRSIWNTEGKYWAGYHRYILGNGQVVPNKHPGHSTFGVTPPNHTSGRNTSSSAAFSVSGMAGGSPSNFGNSPIKASQYEAMASSVASLAKSWGWGKNDITSKNVITHSEAAKMDGYAGERWDLDKLYQGDSNGSGPNKIRGMIQGKMFKGGYIKQTGNYLTHPGEYVIDADSVKLFGIHFYDIINKVEMVSQRKNASIKLILILSQYTPDGFRQTPEDYAYSVPAQEYIYIPGPVFETASSSGSGGSISGNPYPDTSLDALLYH
jgi:hypothetical protein